MLKKLIILTILLFVSGFAIKAWSLTSHKDYATMSIPDCNNCHQTSGVALNHGAMWSKEHRLYAVEKPNNCQDCHQQSFCLDCHTGGGIDANLHASTSGPDYMPKSHRTDFREIHPITAREDPKACYRCHDAKRFCLECHNRFKPSDLAMASHRRQFSDINLKSVGPNHTIFNTEQCQTCHPNGLVPTHQWSADHAREARRNLSTCQTCHPEGDVCMKCHSAATGLKVNPHPRSWGSIKNRLGRASDNRTCLKCHITVPQ
jgi:hypothetical protein